VALTHWAQSVIFIYTYTYIHIYLYMYVCLHLYLCVCVSGYCDPFLPYREPDGEAGAALTRWAQTVRASQNAKYISEYRAHIEASLTERAEHAAVVHAYSARVALVR